MTWRIGTLLCVGLVLGVACSDDSSEGDGGSGAPHDNSGTPSPDSGSGRGAFTGDCSTSRWGNVSEACWACSCELCADTLNVCDQSCVDVIECALEDQCLVGEAATLGCEVNCVDQVCVHGDPDLETGLDLAADFDVCLLQNAPEDRFRACEEECGIVYDRDVCAEYPAE